MFTDCFQWILFQALINATLFNSLYIRIPETSCFPGEVFLWTQVQNVRASQPSAVMQHNNQPSLLVLQGSSQTVEQRRCAAILLVQRHYTHFQC